MDAPIRLSGLPVVADVDHFLIFQEVIGALREADFKEELPGEQGQALTAKM